MNYKSDVDNRARGKKIICMNTINLSMYYLIGMHTILCRIYQILPKMYFKEILKQQELKFFIAMHTCTHHTILWGSLSVFHT